MTPIRQFIDAATTGNTESAAAAFKTAFMDRVRTHLDIKTVELSSSVYSHDKNESDVSDS